MKIVSGLLLGCLVGFAVYFTGCVVLTLIKKRKANKKEVESDEEVQQ